MLKRMIVGLVLTPALLMPMTSVAKADRATDHVSGRVLVKFEPGTLPEREAAVLRAVGGKKVAEVARLDVVVVEVSTSAEGHAVAALSRAQEVEYAELDYRMTPLAAPDDPYFADKQWGLENTGQSIVESVGKVDADMDASSAWDVTTGTTGDAGVRVAILDSGIDQDHEDVSAKIVLQKNFTSSDTLDDLYGHGTHVGGTVGAITGNGVGVAGGCPDCELLSGKVLGDDGVGSHSWTASGIVWATDNGAKVINMSLGNKRTSRTLERAVKYAWQNGAVLAAAAGNSNSTVKIYPAGYDEVIAVAATDNTDAKAPFSNYGSWVDIAAPGVNVFATFPNHPFVIGSKNNRSQNYDFGSGTSMSAPMVSAAAALVWVTQHGTSNANVRSRVEATADDIPGTGKYWTAGRVNAQQAVAP